MTTSISSFASKGISQQYHRCGSRPLLLLLLSRFSRVRLCVIPQTAAHQAPLSLGFSRQKHWSGLPFPSPDHCNKANVAIKSLIWIFWFPSAYKSYIYTLLLFTKCVIKLRLKQCTYLNFKIFYCLKMLTIIWTFSKLVVIPKTTDQSSPQQIQ